MILRVAAVITLISQILLLQVVWDTSGTTAIWFSFVGHPAVAIGFGVAMIHVLQRARSNGQQADSDGGD